MFIIINNKRSGKEKVFMVVAVPSYDDDEGYPEFMTEKKN